MRETNPGLGPVFRVCHRDRIVCMSLITKVNMNLNMNLNMKITLGESVLRMDADVADGSRIISRS